MNKTLKATLRQDREPFKLIRRVQDSIPVLEVYEDGIFRHYGNKFSMAFRFSDINYSIESEEMQTSLMLKYIGLINTFDLGSTTKITISKHRINRAAFKQQYLYPELAGSLVSYRRDVNGIIEHAAEGKSACVKERILTVSAVKKSIEEAREHFRKIAWSLTTYLGNLGSTVNVLSTEERLRIFYDFYRHGEEEFYSFDAEATAKKGHSFKDGICPDSISVYEDYMKVDGRFARVLFLREYAKTIRDSVVQDLSSVCSDMMLSIDVIPVPTGEAVQDAENIALGIATNKANYQRKQNENNNFTSSVPLDIQHEESDVEEFINDLTVRDQKVSLCVMTVVLTADSKEELDRDTASLRSVADSYSLQFGTLRYQQIDGLKTVLPFGIRKIDIFRSLSSESLAVFMPFNAREIQDQGGVFFGINQSSNSMIFLNRVLLKNGNMFVLGASGGGKSMMAKWEATARVLGGDADVIFIDPEREYGPLTKALGGEIITISSTSATHINAMDMGRDYNDGSNPVVLKSEFLMSLCDLISRKQLGAAEKSIIDRCASNVYHTYIDSGYTADPPTLQDFRFELLAQKEPEAKALALEIELFTSGNLNTFAQQTNVDTSNSLICYDIHDLGEQLRTVGMLVVLDSIMNRITANRAAGRKTFIFIDEIYLLLMQEYSANFLYTLWKRMRKYNAYGCGITQNVTDLLLNNTGKTMLANSECVVMLNQSSTDSKALAELFNISDEELYYITNSRTGSGLLRAGDAIVPFINEIPRDSELYKLLSTKPGEES